MLISIYQYSLHLFSNFATSEIVALNERMSRELTLTINNIINNNNNNKRELQQQQ